MMPGGPQLPKVRYKTETCPPNKDDNNSNIALPFGFLNRAKAQAARIVKFPLVARFGRAARCLGRDLGVFSTA